MSSGSKSWVSPDSNESWEKTWWGSDDPAKRRENDYMMIKDHRFRIPGSQCNYGSVQRLTPAFPTAGGVNVPPNARLIVLAKIADRIKGHEFDLGNNLGEARQTGKMALGALGALRDSIKSLKRGDVAAAARALGAKPPKRRLKTKDVSSQWLGLQYGWLPLLSDVYGAAEHMALKLNTGRKRRFRAKKEFKLPQLTSTEYPYVWALDRKITVYGRVVIQEQMTSNRSLGLEDPLGIAWELTPWSFVFDWFIPVADYLDTLNAFQGLHAQVAWTHFAVSQKRLVDTLMPPCDGFTGVVTKPPACWHRHIVLERFSLADVSVPKPEFYGLKDALTPKRIYNAIALGHQAIMGRQARNATRDWDTPSGYKG